MKLGFLIEALHDQIISVRYAGRQISGAALHQLQCRVPFDSSIRGISLHSKRTKKDYVFFCLSGTLFEGRDFIAEALRNGAKAVVVDEHLTHKVPKNVTIIRVKNCRVCLGFVVNALYSFPLKKINLTAITGTNGKTTVAFLLENILGACNMPSGVIGTVHYRFGKRLFRAHNTTPDIVKTFEFLNQMLRAKSRFLFMEVSSHALAQHRIRGLCFNQAVFTNLSQDHLDYHRTMRQYFNAKSLLFKYYLKENATAIINSDDSYGRELAQSIRKDKKIRLVTYGIKKRATVQATNVRFDYKGSSAEICFYRRRFRLRTNLLGVFNMYNILASVSTCLALDIPIRDIVSGLKHVTIPGRLERVPCNRGIRIFVDYAHTEDALRNVLSTLRSLKGNARLIVVFGCGGDRDRAKRASMGKVASELCDQVVITSDNPRTENPQKIIAEIKRGMKKNNYISILDRREAIKKAIDIAQNRDIIVVAGKGHEDYQIIKNRKIVFRDRCVIEQILSQKG